MLPVGGGGNSPEVEEVAAVLSGEDALVDSVPPRMRGGQLRTRRSTANGVVAMFGGGVLRCLIYSSPELRVAAASSCR